MSAESEVFCSRCGVLNTVTRVRCRECGAALARDAGAVPGPAGGAPAPVAPGPPRDRGADDGEEPRICARCRKVNSADALVCMDCGCRLGPLPPLGGWPRESPPPPKPLACPGCGTEMEVGEVFLPLSGLLGQVFADGPRHPLVFRRSQSRRTERVVLPGERLHAQRCPGCNAVWIGPPPERADPVRRLLGS